MSFEEDELYQAYLTQLQSEHRQVKQHLARIEKQLQYCRQGRRAATDVDPLITYLTELRAELAHHFAEEEAGGCIEEAITHRPSLSREAANLEQEDPKLLKLLDRLIDRLGASPRSLNRVQREYRQLVQKICAHEAAESRIVEEGFGMDVD